MYSAIACIALFVAIGAHGQQWLNVELPALDMDEINAERTRKRTAETPSIEDAWDWTTMTQADLMREAAPVLAANADLCGSKVIRYRGELVCDFFPFYMSNEPTANAYTDGVYIYITAGMVRQLRSADEYRAVIGHEVGHILGGHLEKIERKGAVGAVLGAVLAGGLIAVAGDVPGGIAADTILTAAQIGEALGRQRFSQMFELEADYIGAYMLARAGGDVDAAKDMWKRWGWPPAKGSWLSFHPSDQQRLALLTASAREVERKRDGGIALLPTEREKKRTPRKPKFFSPSLERWDTNGNGEISCREARRQGIAPIPPDHPAWHYAPGQHRSPTYTRTGRVIYPDLPPQPKCCGRLGGCRAQERPLPMVVE